MRYFVLRYTLAADYLERRSSHRAAHLSLATRFRDSGQLLLAGACLDPADEALLVFRCASQSEVEAFAKTDPYVKHGLVRAYAIREWAVAAGSLYDDGDEG